MKSILISVKPKWVEKILNGEKTIEVRKSAPKIDLPCKVYIYCTKGKNRYDICVIHNKSKDKKDYSFCKIGNGKVVAEFTLNEIEELKNTLLPTIPTCVYLTKTKRYASAMEKESCLSQDEIYTYLSGRDGYAWYIDNLIVYDNPKELSDFKKENKCHYANYEQGCCFETCTFFDLKDCDGKYSKITVAPQSWCYVEE